MTTNEEKELAELRENILSGLKAGNGIMQVRECLRVSDKSFVDALFQLVEGGEIDLILT